MASINISQDKICVDSIEFIGGDFQELEFYVFDSQTGEPVDLNTFRDIYWILYPFGDPVNPVNRVECFVKTDESNATVVELQSRVTQNLRGLYQHQLVLIDGVGKEFRPVYGNINIIPRSQIG